MIGADVYRNSTVNPSPRRSAANGRPAGAIANSVRPHLQERALMKLQQLNAAGDLKDHSIPSSNRLEALKGDRKGEYSIRINKHWRICFRWRDGHAFDVEIVDYH